MGLRGLQVRFHGLPLRPRGGLRRLRGGQLGPRLFHLRLGHLPLAVGGDAGLRHPHLRGGHRGLRLAQGRPELVALQGQSCPGLLPASPRGTQGCLRLGHLSVELVGVQFRHHLTCPHGVALPHQEAHQAACDAWADVHLCGLHRP